MRSSGIRVRFKESGTYKIGSQSYDLIAEREYCFLSMTPEECTKFKSSYINKLSYFKATTDTSGAYKTFIYRQVDRAKNFAKVAVKMPKRSKKSEKEPEEITVPVVETTKSIEMLDGEPKLVTKNIEGDIVTLENIPDSKEEFNGED